MNNLRINLSAARAEVPALDEAMAEQLEEAVRFFEAIGNGLVTDDARCPLAVELCDLAEVDIAVALYCLRWLMVESPAEYCKKIAERMLRTAVMKHAETIGERGTTLLLNVRFNRLPRDLQIFYFSDLGKLAECCTTESGTFEKPGAYALDMARNSMGDTDYDSISDPDEFVLDAPYRMLKDWGELATCCAPEVQAAARMGEAAIQAESQWRTGTKLEFDFCSGQIDCEYWVIWRAVNTRSVAETLNQAKEALITLFYA